MSNSVVTKEELSIIKDQGNCRGLYETVLQVLSLYKSKIELFSTMTLEEIINECNNVILAKKKDITDAVSILINLNLLTSKKGDTNKLELQAKQSTKPNALFEEIKSTETIDYKLDEILKSTSSILDKVSVNRVVSVNKTLAEKDKQIKELQKQIKESKSSVKSSTISKDDIVKEIDMYINAADWKKTPDFNESFKNNIISLLSL